MSQVNLLPREILERHKEKRLTYIVAGAGLIAALVVVAIFLLQTTKLSGVNDDIQTAEANNASVQTQIDGLQNYAALQEKAQQEQSLLSAAYVNDVSFSQLLMDVSRVIPSDEYLDTLTFQVTGTPTAPTTTTTTTPTFVGAMSATGKGVSVETLSTWLTRMESVKGWVNAWMGSVTRDSTGTSFSFSSGVDLTDGVLSPRGKAANDAQG